MDQNMIDRVHSKLMNAKQRNGQDWPKDPLERWILAWLQIKAEHGYRWSEWAVADETKEACYAYFRNVWPRPKL